jgi:prepilin peptidase CpaA
MINAALFISWALAVVFFDCRLRRIPNWLVITGLTVACVLVASGHSPFKIDLSDAALGVPLGLIGLLPFYLFGLMGAADVKVFATLGAWCGFHALSTLWVVASMGAGIHAVYLLASAAIMRKRNVSHSHMESSLNADGSVNDHRDVTKAAAEGPSRYTFMIGGRRATPYAALLAVSAIANLMLHVFEAAP